MPADLDLPGMEITQFSLGEVIRVATTNAARSPLYAGKLIYPLLDPALPESLLADRRCLQQLIEDLLLAIATFSPSEQIRLSAFPSFMRTTEVVITLEGAGRPGAGYADVSSAENPTLERFHEAVKFFGGDSGFQVEGMTPTIWCRLPMQRIEPPSTSATNDSLRGAASGTREPGGLRILMAEDNSINQRVGKLILQRAGYNIDLVADGNEALEAHRIEPYDLILMDCQMPTMDGFEATRQIRAISEARQPIIIAVTANALVGERERCLAAGMDDYLSKPFQAEQLVAIVGRWVRHAKPSHV